MTPETCTYKLNLLNVGTRILFYFFMKLDVFYKPTNLFRTSRFVFFQNLAVDFKRERLLLLKYLENKLDQDDIEKMNGLMSAALVPEHCIIELKGLNGIAVSNLLLRDGV